ncbi:MAG: membrane protein insertion efficiency factor YidD [Candidatus Omnitrophica bacterium]|nr:membrane protein insertion efficiency factor YidD [Candidatus Omnitrophota bacterium]
MRKVVLRIIRLYRISVSPLLGNHCRFTPSCSLYCEEAVSRHGLLKGMLKGLSRISRCHPFSRGGFDPVAK